ncbi:exo-alpha-sialidase [Coralliovum pocilloporae]|uniref:exo-alpha-sialidase n=1 Tax=Coralliovum pocilloporae TaxID=3066369 RepID=UPI003306C685
MIYPLTRDDEPADGDYSISFWFKAKSDADGALLSKGNYFSKHHGWRFFLNDGKLIFRVTTNDRKTAAQKQPYKLNKWHHVVGVIDRAKGQVRLYLDGRGKPSADGGGGAVSNRLSNRIIQSPQPLRIGYASNPDTKHADRQLFKGRIASLRIYKARLTTKQIKKLRKAGARQIVKSPKARFRESVVFRRTDQHCYRIPAISRLPSGKLMALAERRHGYWGKLCSDHGKIDIVAAYSKDNGKHWSKEQVVVSYKHGDFTAMALGDWVAVNNPVPVVDKRGRVHIMFNVSTSQYSFNNSQKAVTRGAALRTSWIVSSKNEGKSWSAPKNITKQVKKPKWRFYSHGPGHGLKASNGRLIIPTYHNNGPKAKSRVSLAFSDNNGKRWRLGKPTPNGGVSESQAVELLDGSILVNSRRVGDRKPFSRRVSIARDMSNLSRATPDKSLPSSRSHGSFSRYSWPKQRQGKSLQKGGDYARRQTSMLVFVNPAHTKHRRNLTVRISEDEGQTWAYSRRIRARSTAYSDSIATKNGGIGVLYEGTISQFDSKQAILFATFTPEWVKGGKR